MKHGRAFVTSQNAKTVTAGGNTLQRPASMSHAKWMGSLVTACGKT